MCRRKTLAMQEIEQSCGSHNLEVNELLGKSRLLLKTYRAIHWTAVGLKKLDTDDSYCFSTEEMELALHYLNSYSVNEKPLTLERKLRERFDPRWIVELVESALVQVNVFPKKGNLYYEILQRMYFTTNKYTEADLLSILKLERSRFYELKKEAFLVFGLAFWGTILPKISAMLEEEPLLAYEF